MRQYPELRWLHAVPNGLAASSVIAAAKMKRQGMTKGIPDVCLPVARRGAHGLYIELKRKDGGKLSPEQRRLFEELPGHPALPAQSELGAIHLEPHASWMTRIAAEWSRRTAR